LWMNATFSRIERMNAAFIRNRRGSGDDADDVGLRPLLTLGDLELDALILLEAAVAVGLDRAVVDEDVRSVVDLDEAVALFAVEPLHDALSHDVLLRVEDPGRARK
jgi:hypothetical protein